MSDGVTYLGLVVVFGFVLVAAARLGTGPQRIFEGLFAPPAGRDWPPGVQEGDAPRFAVAHLDGLRPGVPVTVGSVFDGDQIGPPTAELFDLGSRRLDPPRR